MTIREAGETLRVTRRRIAVMQSVIKKLAEIRVRLPRLAVLALIVASAGCVAPGPILSVSRPNVILFTSTAGYFPDLGGIEERLDDEGVYTTVVYPDAHKEIAERLIAARNTGRLQGPVVIVGYSCGADKALVVSRRLGQRGIVVDKLVLVEAHEGGRVPGNVRECLNIFKPQPWCEWCSFFSGCTVLAENPATQLVNYDIREYNDGRYDGDNHFTLTANPYLQDLMLDEILAPFEADDEEGVVMEEPTAQPPSGAVEAAPPVETIESEPQESN